ncbi:hypothetical protein D9M69_701850 [compost metagenome]
MWPGGDWTLARAQLQVPVVAWSQQQGDGIWEGHIVDIGGIDSRRRFLGHYQQHGRRTFAEQCGGFQHGLLQAIAFGRESRHFAGVAAQDRPLADDGVVHREAELGG